MGRPRGAGAETRRLTRSGYEKESNDENGTYLDGAVSDVDLFSSCGWVRREAGISNGSAGSSTHRSAALGSCSLEPAESLSEPATSLLAAGVQERAL